MSGSSPSAPERRLACAARLVAAGGGAGWLPLMPGTWGSLLGLALGLALLAWSPAALIAGTLALIALGTAAIPAATGIPWRPGTTGEDPGWIVIDEVAGQCLALLGLHHPSWPGALAAFALFRLFDIAKPGPIGRADRLGGAFGIMADDILAGAAAAVIVRAVTVKDVLF